MGLAKWHQNAYVYAKYIHVCLHFDKQMLNYKSLYVKNFVFLLIICKIATNFVFLK